MRLFEKTLRGLSPYLDEQRSLSKSVQASARLTEQSGSTSQKSPLIIQFDEADLSRYFSPSPLRHEKISIGDHADFKSLSHQETTHHYAVSLFMDIKGSTGLIEIVRDLEELRRLKDTILSLAIHVCHYFGGHVQRLQGDGVFVLFARKGAEPNDAIIGALNAAALLTYFVKYELEPELVRMGIEKPIRIRTGIDFGRTEDVLWSRYGIVGCSELTTTSIHTDFAAKLQQRASSNGIVIGDNLRESLDLDSKYLSIRKYRLDSIEKEDKAIRISSSRNYAFWVFDWERFLLSYSCCRMNGDKLEFQRPTKRLKCIRQDNGFEYFENSYAIEKGIELKFELLNQHGEPFVNYPFKKIEWKIINTGREASKEEKVQVTVPDGDNKTSVTANTAYLGQHKMECTVGTYPNRDTISFHVFVRPDKLLAG